VIIYTSIMLEINDATNDYTAQSFVDMFLR